MNWNRLQNGWTRSRWTQVLKPSLRSWKDWRSWLTIGTPGYSNTENGLKSSRLLRQWSTAALTFCWLSRIYLCNSQTLHRPACLQQWSSKHWKKLLRILRYVTNKSLALKVYTYKLYILQTCLFCLLNFLYLQLLYHNNYW